MRYDVPRWSGRCSVVASGTRSTKNEPDPVPCCGDDVHHFAARRRRDHDERALDRVGELDRVVAAASSPARRHCSSANRASASRRSLSCPSRVGGGRYAGAADRAEESVAQVANGRRLGDVPAGLDVAARRRRRRERLLRERRPTLCVVDSSPHERRRPRSTPFGATGRHVRTTVFGRERDGVALLIVGHVTKDGELAGPRSRAPRRHGDQNRRDATDRCDSFERSSTASVDRRSRTVGDGA